MNTKDLLSNSEIKYKKIINLRKLFCKYTYLGLYAEFLSNSSLILSMHNDGDAIAPLYEISLDGKIIRQITDK